MRPPLARRDPIIRSDVRAPSRTAGLVLYAVSTCKISANCLVENLVENSTRSAALAECKLGDAATIANIVSRVIGRSRIRRRQAGWSPLSGAIIEFEVLRPEIDRMEPGRNHCVERDNGVVTFKRLDHIKDDHLIFRALNRRKYLDDIRVERSRIIRMALARGGLRPFD